MIAPSRRARLLILAACLGAAGLALVRARPPAPAPADAPPGQFSAIRARDRLADLLGDEAPHPVGSAANDAVRARLLAQLRALGLQPEEQRAFTCDEHGTCAAVTNVIVPVAGAGEGPAVLLAAHHDSVPAGPGAADDGHGVALALEVIRAVLHDGPPARPLLAVFTDAEEVGLLGARAFVRDPRFAGVGVVINAEARGTTGPSRMFETSDGNAGLLAAYAAGVARPAADSLSFEIYQRMPNDTDLTVFREAGAQGLNFAFIGGVSRYHTPRDDLAHLDLGSVQHQGDAVLGVTRALLASDMSARTAANATYADLLGAVLVRWPAALNLPLAGLAVLLLLVAAARAVRGGHTRPRAIAGGLLAALLAPAAGCAAAFGLVRLVEAASGPLGPWPAGWAITLAAAAAAASAAAVALLRALGRRLGAPALTLGAWLLWALLGVAVAWALPGGCVFLVAPALVAGVGLALARRLAVPAALAGGLACALLAPLLPALVDALGLDAVVAGAVVGFLWTAAAAACAEGQGERDMSRGAWLFALLAVVAAALAAAAPRVTFDHPGRLNVVHLTDLDAGAGARWVVDAPTGLPASLAALAVWGPPGPALPWSSRASLRSAPAPAPAQDGPSLTVTRTAAAGDLREISATLRARPGALMVMALIPAASLAAITVGGAPLDPAALRRGPSDSYAVTIFGPPADGVELVARVRDAAPWRLVDALPGLPEGARGPADARPDTLVPTQWGDLTASVRSQTP